MTGRRSLGLVVGREVREATRRRSFWIIAGLVLLGSTAAVVLPEIVGGDGSSYTVGIVGDDDDLLENLESAGESLDAEVDVQPMADVEDARGAVSDDRADLAVVVGPAPQVIARSGEAEELVAVTQQALAVQALLDRLAEAGLSETEVVEVLDVPPVPVVRLDTENESRRGSAAIISIVLYLILLMLTIQVATGVAIEKANRISEVLLAIVRPGALLFGKVIGVGLIGAATLLVAAVPVVVKLVAGGSLPAGLPAAVAGGAAWFLLGVALYLTIAGALGALVERQEEAGTVMAPLSIVLIASYLVGQSAADTPLGAVMAVFPLSAPLVMPSRIAIGAASTPEILLSLALSVAAVVVAARVGATIYRRAVVQTGQRLTVREALRSA